MDMSGVDLNLLVSLDALLSELNVTRAAERIHLSQPALSAQLARLRSLFGDPLLIPAESGRGMVATARALALKQELNVLLKGLETLIRRQPGFDPQSAQQTFAIAISDSSAASLPFLEHLARAAGPGILVALRSAESGAFAELLNQGEIDLLVASERSVPPNMKAKLLIKERFVMAQRKGHPRGTAPLDLDAYCGLRHILVSTSGGSFSGFMDEHLQRLGRRREVVLSLQQFTLVPELLAASDYVCTCPSRLAARFADRLDAFELPFEAQGFTLCAAWHPRNHADPANLWLRELFAQAAAHTGPPRYFAATAPAQTSR